MTAPTTPLSPVGEQCPNCNASMAPDQRYCLACGQRRGDPRLPFMDAVVFMDAVTRPAGAPAPPPPPADRKPRMSANASLIAGIATLILAIGVGVLIGRSGDSGSPTANAAPQIIKVGGGPETASAETSSVGGGSGKKGKASGKGKKSAKGGTDSSGTSKAAAEVLKPAGDVKLPPPTVQPGGKCESGAAGCKHGEFTGDFFGE